MSPNNYEIINFWEKNANGNTTVRKTSIIFDAYEMFL